MPILTSRQYIGMLIALAYIWLIEGERQHAEPKFWCKSIIF